MPRQLPTTDSDDHDYIQFRGAQSSVTHDATGIRFSSGKRWGYYVQEPLPVVDVDTDPADAPADGVARPVAERVVEENRLVCWGVCCPVDGCGKVFGTPKSVSSHMAVHADPGPDVDTSDPDASRPAKPEDSQ